MANPNPPPPPEETRWQPGQSGNPGGKTSEHRKAEIRAAELAAKVQLDLVEALAKAVDDCEGDKDKLAYLNKEVNALIKNAQDRGYGTPKQSIDLESPKGSMSPPTTVKVEGVAGKSDKDD